MPFDDKTTGALALGQFIPAALLVAVFPELALWLPRTLGY